MNGSPRIQEGRAPSVPDEAEQEVSKHPPTNKKKNSSAWCFSHKSEEWGILSEDADE